MDNFENECKGARRHRPVKRVPEALLTHWNRVDAAELLRALADHAKPDPSFHARKDPRSMRWHASLDGRDYSFVLTGPMFVDDRDNQGGLGAVKFVQHLLRCNFRKATQLLMEDARLRPFLPRANAS